ncbi:hypothetical protein F8154_13440 [Alkaliphilus pronyensis]|uniref:Uncharacterized protein n=1 Tax=Alkaliphilus pronyensis TaxID=1482732 RepID=A0A6I0F1X3_9FIRM|nr:hypothetical protein [Alkaliphilus pronyensis]KAB3530919.1 hypothetical protein F8154_13440 [Alkaliphilus pronyensis]
MISRKRSKLPYYFGMYIILFFAYQIDIVYANSSWRWLTSSPRELLPIAIIFTLAIEYIGIVVFGKVKQMNWRRTKILGIIIAANIASFLLPFVMRTIAMRATSVNWLEAWEDAFGAGPFYIVLFGYLFITILFEIPVMYGNLKKHTMSKKLLFRLIIALNIVTTCIVAVLERILYKGQW